MLASAPRYSRAATLLLLTLAPAFARAQSTVCAATGGEGCNEADDFGLLQAKARSAAGRTPTVPAIITPIIGWWDTCWAVGGSVQPTNANLVIKFQGGTDLDPNGVAPSHSSDEVLYFTNAGGGNSGSGYLTKAFLQSLAGASSSVAKGIKDDKWDGLSFDLEQLSGFSQGDDAVQILSDAFDGCHNAGLNVLVSTSHTGNTAQLGGTLPPGTTLAAFLTSMQALTNIDIFAPQMYGTDTPPGCDVPGASWWGSYAWSATYTAPAIPQSCSASVPLGSTPNAAQVVAWLSGQSNDWKNVEGFTLWGSPSNWPSGCAV